jgi:ribokinase
MARGHVCVLGSFMMDLVVRAPRRPRPGETVIGTDFQRFLGGKGFNQAVAAARAGARTTMLGRLGADGFGREFLDRLAGEGIDARHVVVDPVEGTGIGAPLVEDGGENSIVVVPRANAGMTVRDVERAAGTLRDADVLLAQLELPVDPIVTAARRAREGHAAVVLNPAPATTGLEQLHGLVDVLVPNQQEAAMLAGLPAGARPADPVAVGRALRDRFGADVVLTLGAQGALVVDGDGDPFEVKGHAVAAVDTVGAGDAFCGALGAGLARGAGLREAAVFANAAGALAVTRAGAEPSMPTHAAVLALLA